jgi:peptidoglycan/LPS O-acetylase OafA/YrhL
MSSLSEAAAPRQMNLADKLALADFRPSGFDYMRLILALGVVAAHSVLAAHGIEAYADLYESPLRGPVRLILPMFFALSGFLVAGSLERTKTVVSFLGLRAIRIYPALVVEVLLSAFILGPLLTTVTLAEYFSNPVFHSYLWNIIGHVHFFLPGVFQYNPWPGAVNQQLWTVPYELLCYIVIATLAVMAVVKRRYLAILGGVAMLLAYGAHRLYEGEGFFLTKPMGGELLVASFLFGVAVFLYRHQIPWSRKAMVLSGVASVLFAGIIPYGDFLAPIAAAYFTVLLGLTNPARILLLKGADYSYGIFLYGFAIQQAFTTLGLWTHHWYVNLLFCIPLSAMFAAFSWHCVEKPALKLRKNVMAVEGWWIARRGAPQNQPA